MTSQDQSSGRKRGRGQSTKFREEYVEQVRALCEAGVRDEEIAAHLGVSSRSLHRWQEWWPQFFDARELKHDRKPPSRPRRFRPELCAGIRSSREGWESSGPTGTIIEERRSAFFSIPLACGYQDRLTAFSCGLTEWPPSGSPASAGSSAGGGNAQSPWRRRSAAKGAAALRLICAMIGQQH